MANTASGVATVDGTADGRVLITGVAPGVIPTPWRVSAGENSATIDSFPTPPASPAWSIDVIGGRVFVLNFPREYVQETPIINLNMSGTARGRTLFPGRRIAESTFSANGGEIINMRRS